MKKIDLLDEKSDFSKEILEKTPSWIVSWGNSLFFIFILILLLLSWIVKYPDIIKSEVEITSDSPSINIVSKTSGILKELYFKDGDQVKQNNWVGVIENSSKTKDIQKIDSLLTLSFDRLISNYPSNLELGDLQPYSTELSKNISQYNFFKTYNPQVVAINSNKDRLNKTNNTQVEYLRQKEVARKEYEVGKSNYDRNLSMYKAEVISKSELDKAEIELLQSENRYKSYNTNISSLESDKSIINKDNTQLALEKENQNIDYITNISNSIQEMRFQLQNWKNKFLLTAPINGKINFFEIWKVNQFIKNEQVLFTIIPDNSTHYFARAKMPVSSSGKAKIGQSVNMKLNNYPFEEFGVLTGKIKKITNVSNENLYYVIISLDNGLITNQNKQVSPNNLIGEAEIITDDLRLIERFIYTIIKNLKQ